jgi:hydroxymethylglutaryl-CoA lyase
MMQGLGIDTGVDLRQVVDAGQFISAFLQRKAASRAGNAIAAKRNPGDSGAATGRVP